MLDSIFRSFCFCIPYFRSTYMPDESQNIFQVLRFTSKDLSSSVQNTNVTKNILSKTTFVGDCFLDKLLCYLYFWEHLQILTFGSLLFCSVFPFRCCSLSYWYVESNDSSLQNCFSELCRSAVSLFDVRKSDASKTLLASSHHLPVP